MNVNKIQKKRILVISLSGIGNTLLAMPFLKALRQIKPDAEIFFLGYNKAITQIAEDAGLIDNMLIFRQPLFKKLALIRRLRKSGFDYSFTLFPSNKWQFNIFAFIAGAKNRVTHAYDCRRLRTLSFLQNIKIPANPGLHDTEQNLKLLKAVNAEKKDISKTPYLVLKPYHSKFADDFIKKYNLKDKFLIGVHPGAGGSLTKKWQGLYKRWPQDYYIKLIGRLIKLKNAYILIFGGPEEEKLKKSIKRKASYKNNIIAVSSESIKQTAALIQKCNFFISNDTGLMHLSCAVNVPALGIFGPTNPERTAPRGENSRIIEPRLDCAPCLKYPFETSDSRIKCGHSMKCMRSITVEAVILRLKDSGWI